MPEAFENLNPILKIIWLSGINIYFITSNFKDESLFTSSTGGPRYMWPFYLRFCVCAIEKWPFSWNLSSNLRLSLVFYMQINYMPAYFLSPYLSHIMRSTCIVFWNFFSREKVTGGDDFFDKYTLRNPRDHWPDSGLRCCFVTFNAVHRNNSGIDKFINSQSKRNKKSGLRLSLRYVIDIILCWIVIRIIITLKPSYHIQFLHVFTAKVKVGHDLLFMFFSPPKIN
jgi:hypothetical protein